MLQPKTQSATSITPDFRLISNLYKENEYAAT
jgi:hypothetical protein